MDIQLVQACAPEEVQRLIARVPFFKDLCEDDELQTLLLLQQSRLVTVNPGTTIMRGGDTGNWLYFILSGRVDVVVEKADGSTSLAALSAGELFGDIALFTDTKRVATIRGAEEGGDVKLLALDFKVFGALDDFSNISLPVKLKFYRMLVQRARWRLEKNKIRYSRHNFFKRLREMPHITAAAESLEELKQLKAQAVFLTELLLAWNDLCVADKQDWYGEERVAGN